MKKIIYLFSFSILFCSFTYANSLKCEEKTNRLHQNFDQQSLDKSNAYKFIDTDGTVLSYNAFTERAKNTKPGQSETASPWVVICPSTNSDCIEKGVALQKAAPRILNEMNEKGRKGEKTEEDVFAQFRTTGSQSIAFKEIGASLESQYIHQLLKASALGDIQMPNDSGHSNSRLTYGFDEKCNLKYSRVNFNFFDEKTKTQNSCAYTFKDEKLTFIEEKSSYEEVCKSKVDSIQKGLAATFNGRVAPPARVAPRVRAKQ